MTLAGWVFMGSAWVLVGGLFVYCFGRLLREDARRR
jgi:hypothetical protein